MTFQELTLWPAEILVRFTLMLFGYSALPYVWEIWVTGFLALYIWMSILSAILQWIRGKLGLQGGAQ